MDLFDFAALVFLNTCVNLASLYVIYRIKEKAFLRQLLDLKL